ncbi:hypothetical protein F5X96DRAFT_624995 [Biscogniauxia mediterranea]|nr:hypothetical protein F5X96DRAFT_624995 [Biscogniauxia mediterranea]
MMCTMDALLSSFFPSLLSSWLGWVVAYFPLWSYGIFRPCVFCYHQKGKRRLGNLGASFLSSSTSTSLLSLSPSILPSFVRGSCILYYFFFFIFSGENFYTIYTRFLPPLGAVG